MSASDISAENTCKICSSANLALFAHTAKCRECGVLLYFPYPESDGKLVSDGEGKGWPREEALRWYSESSFLNHSNFTDMLRFAMDESQRNKKLDLLDYGGGGGQFALVAKSHFPEAEVYITDIADDALLDEWRPLNRQIPFKDFAGDETKFDIIFMNDVFEHVSDPLGVLRQLAGKLKAGGRIFVDTPKQFWIYPIARTLSRSLYAKVLRGTVTTFHLQIWSRNAFEKTVADSGLAIVKYHETSEFTMPAEFYLQNMGITNRAVRFIGGLFYRNAKYLTKNKIMCVLTKA
jgi:2-polyprenyl-3-methyl-5-hydroxy-6-metoxy-1,4-benzoquinol methylase